MILVRYGNGIHFQHYPLALPPGNRDGHAGDATYSPAILHADAQLHSLTLVSSGTEGSDVTCFVFKTLGLAPNDSIFAVL